MNYPSYPDPSNNQLQQLKSKQYQKLISNDWDSTEIAEHFDVTTPFNGI